jgi:hypothetical protein
MSKGPRLNFEDIAACEDADQLREWMRDANAAADDIKDQLEAEREAGDVCEDWEERATGAMVCNRMAASKCRRKLIAMGEYEYSETERLGHEIKKLEKIISRQKIEISALHERLHQQVAA